MVQLDGIDEAGGQSLSPRCLVHHHEFEKSTPKPIRVKTGIGRDLLSLLQDEHPPNGNHFLKVLATFLPIKDVKVRRIYGCAVIDVIHGSQANMKGLVDHCTD